MGLGTLILIDLYLPLFGDDGLARKSSFEVSEGEKGLHTALYNMWLPGGRQSLRTEPRI